MTTVYVVEAGAYSDRWIVGVWSDRFEAEAVARTSDAIVYEHTLDEPLTREQRAALRNESFFTVSMTASGQQAQARNCSGGEETNPNIISFARGYDGGRFITDLYAANEEHAIKIANDRRTAWLAAGGEHAPGGKSRNYGWVSWEL